MQLTRHNIQLLWTLSTLLAAPSSGLVDCPEACAMCSLTRPMLPDLRRVYCTMCEDCRSSRRSQVNLNCDVAHCVKIDYGTTTTYAPPTQHPNQPYCPPGQQSNGPGPPYPPQQPNQPYCPPGHQTNGPQSPSYPTQPPQQQPGCNAMPCCMPMCCGNTGGGCNNNNNDMAAPAAPSEDEFRFIYLGVPKGNGAGSNCRRSGGAGCSGPPDMEFMKILQPGMPP